MANPFVPHVTISQSDDNSNLIVTDSSNYAVNDDNITPNEVTSRSVAVTDSNGQPVITINLTLQSDNVTYSGLVPVTKDFYYSYASTFIVNAVAKIGITRYVSIGYYLSSFVNVIKNNLGDCGCAKGGICSDVSWSWQLKEAAIIFAAKQMGVNSQTCIDSANTFINALLN